MWIFNASGNYKSNCIHWSIYSFHPSLWLLYALYLAINAISSVGKILRAMKHCWFSFHPLYWHLSDNVHHSIQKRVTDPLRLASTSVKRKFQVFTNEALSLSPNGIPPVILISLYHRWQNSGCSNGPQPLRHLFKRKRYLLAPFQKEKVPPRDLNHTPNFFLQMKRKEYIPLTVFPAIGFCRFWKVNNWQQILRLLHSSDSHLVVKFFWVA